MHGTGTLVSAVIALNALCLAKARLVPSRCVPSRWVNPPSWHGLTHLESFTPIFFHSYNISFERNSKKIITRSGSFF